MEALRIFRAKSPCKLGRPRAARYRPYQGQESVRKTRSSALPGTYTRGRASFSSWAYFMLISRQARTDIRTSPRSRVETASTPDLPDNAEARAFDASKHSRRDSSKLGRAATCFEHLRWTCVFLNLVILIFGCLYLGGGISFYVGRDVLLSLMENRDYAVLTGCLYLAAALCYGLAFAGLWVSFKRPRGMKNQAKRSLAISLIMVTILAAQDMAVLNIEKKVEPRLLASLDDGSTSWDYFQRTFKCCGVRGFLDWCTKLNTTQTGTYLGTYVCYVPDSCCTNYVEEGSERNKRKHETCSELLDSNKTRNYGCITLIKMEIRQLGKMYRIVTLSAAIIMILLTVSSLLTFWYVIK